MILEQKGREILRPSLEAIGKTLLYLGFSPTLVTLAGLILNIAAGVVLGFGYIQWGGIILLIAMPFDALDGTVARLSGRVSRFGTFWDATLDRFSEIAVFLGLIVYYSQSVGAHYIPLAVIALTGSLMVSYTRARAESLGVECKVGFAHRPARMIIITIGFILNQPVITIAVIAILANLTAFHRIFHTWQMTGGEDGGWALPRDIYVPRGFDAHQSDEIEKPRVRI